MALLIKLVRVTLPATNIMANSGVAANTDGNSGKAPTIKMTSSKAAAEIIVDGMEKKIHDPGWLGCKADGFSVPLDARASGQDHLLANAHPPAGIASELM
jgi:hypothetical protein